MKNQVRNLALSFLATVLSLSVSLASEPQETGALKGKAFDASMYRVINTMKVNLKLEKIQGMVVKVSLKDEHNQVLQRDYVSKKSVSFSQKYDLAELPDGTYHFEITDGTQVIIKDVQVGTGQVRPVDYRTLALK